MSLQKTYVLCGRKPPTNLTSSEIICKRNNNLQLRKIHSIRTRESRTDRKKNNKKYSNELIKITPSFLQTSNGIQKIHFMQKILTCILLFFPTWISMKFFPNLKTWCHIHNYFPDVSYQVVLHTLIIVKNNSFSFYFLALRVTITIIEMQSAAEVICYALYTCISF